MKEKLEKKIEEVLEYIISKPVESITNEDFAILSGELKDIRFKEGEEERNKKYAETLAGLVSTSSYGFGSK